MASLARPFVVGVEAPVLVVVHAVYARALAVLSSSAKVQQLEKALCYVLLAQEPFRVFVVEYLLVLNSVLNSAL